MTSKSKINCPYTLFVMFLFFVLPTVAWAAPVLIYPTGGETFKAGSDSINIQWTGQPPGTAKIKIQYTWYGEGHSPYYFAYIDENVPAGTTSYQWNIPCEIYGRIVSGPWGMYPTATTEGKIRVLFYDGGGGLLDLCYNNPLFTVLECTTSPYTSVIWVYMSRHG